METLAVVWLLYVLGSVTFVFLYWRAGRRELAQTQELFDAFGILLGGALLGGRILDFFVRWDYYQFSLLKLVFFNVYGGFSIYGAIVGSIVVGYLYFKKKRSDTFLFYDCLVAPFSLFLAIASVGNYIRYDQNLSYVYFFVGYLIIFWILKRFEMQKRKEGFFAFLFLVLFSVLELVVYNFRRDRVFLNGFLPLDLALPILLLGTSSVVWYRMANKHPTADSKAFFARALISIFKIKRILTSVREADNLAKTIIFLPVSLANASTFLVKYAYSEIRIIAVGFLHNLGFKK